MLDKNIYGSLSLLFVVLSGAPYLYSILAGKTKPHVFTQLIWGLAAGVAAAAQWASQAGPGAWAAALTALFSLVFVGLSFSHGEKNITRSDWVAFILGLSAIPLWYITDNPLAAAVLATLSDLIGYYPTFRKSYSKPHQEMAFSYFISNVKHVITLFAMTEYSLTTVVYPAALLMANTAFIILVVWRRRVLANKA